MGADSSEEGLPSFFKVVRYPAAPHLALPTAYVRRYLEKISKTPILRTETGEHSWSLKIKKIGDDYCFCDGWEKLAKDAELRIMEIVVFSPIDTFNFEVSFFDVNGDEKYVTLNNTNFPGDSDDDDDEDAADENDEVVADEEKEDDEAMANANLCFQKIISDKSHRYIMGLPKKFVIAAELEDKRAITINHEGKEWSIGLLVEKFHNRLCLSSGWSAFRQYYLAHLLKNKTPRKHQTPTNVDHGVKRKRGRPWLQKPGGGGGGGVGGGGVNFKIEHEAEVVKRKRGRRPLVKIENRPEVVKRKRGRPRIKKSGAGGGGGVKVEDGRKAAEVEKVKRKRGKPRVEKDGGDGGDGTGGVKIEDGQGVEGKVAKRKRGRPKRMLHMA